MTITYDDIKYKLQPPLDCSEIKDLRGQYFHNRIITNYENTDFSGCVLYHCFPSGIPNAFELNPAQSEEDVTLKGADLSGVYLRGANLYEANLYEANLSGANLARANLQGANLSGADLKEANLAMANLQEANLEGANLRRANLYGARLKGATYNEEYLFLSSNITEDQLDSMTFVEDED